jgi:hypothetical protein
MAARAQSHVVGVALMLGLTVTAIGALVLGVGTALDSQAAGADAAHVADDLDAALDATGAHGHHTDRLTFATGQLRTVERDLRVLRNGSVVQYRSVGGLTFETGDRRVGYVAGAVVRGRGEAAWLVAQPPITTASSPGVVVVGAPRLAAGDVALSGSGGVTAVLSTNVSHDRTDLGRGQFAVAVETATPTPLIRYFERQNATVAKRDFDDDGLDSVVASYPGRRQGYLVVHDLGLEVEYG